VKFLKFGLYIVNVPTQDFQFVVFLLYIYKLAFGSVICNSALEIIGGLGLSSPLIVSFQTSILPHAFFLMHHAVTVTIAAVESVYIAQTCTGA
jgi:hypothetical protein